MAKPLSYISASKSGRFVVQILGWRLMPLALVLLMAGAQSCIPRRRLAYLQPIAGRADSVFTPKAPVYLLQPADVLSIRLTGPDAAALLPFGVENNASQAGGVSSMQAYVSGYSITDSGTVELPVLGRIRVTGLTVPAAEARIQARLDQYTRGAVARLKLVSFKVSVLGEVRNPSTFYVYNERLTLPEALGFAGDLTDAADRRSLRLIRNQGGLVTVTTLDLTDRRLLQSPYFYLQPGDALYVQPLRAKADRLNLPAISLALTGVTTVLVIINLVTR